MIVSRRRLFGIGAAFVAAPAIVRVANLMPVSAQTGITVPPPGFTSADPPLMVEDWMAQYIRPQMLQLAASIDRELYEALGRPDLVGKI